MIIVREDKSAVVSNMLKESTGKPRKLIEEIGADTIEPNSDRPVAVSEEGPSMLELMMAAQSEAKKADDVVKQKVREKQSKKFGGGFKKGFFGNDTKPTKKSSEALSSQPHTNKVASSSATASSAPPSSGTSAGDIPTVVPHQDKKNSLVMDEVQEAMRGDANPLLEKVKQGGLCLLVWV